MRLETENQMKGEMTVFLSLLFIIFISFTGSILESASLQGIKSERRADMSLAMDSVFAEYQTRLFELYHIFSLEGSYESGTFSEEAIGDRLNFYAGTDAEQEIIRMQLLTDNKGQAFYEQAVRWMETDMGQGLLEKIPQMEELWKEQEQHTEDRETEMDDALAEVGETLPSEENPFMDFIEMRNSDFLSKLMPEGTKISEKIVTQNELPSGRELAAGRGEFNKQVLGNEGVSDILFGEYLLKHFNNAVKKEEGRGGGLAYELEYILEGTDSDVENLTKVLRKIQMTRLALNYTYLITDQEKCGQAQTWAAALSAVLLIPEMTEVLKHALLLVWSYKETITDMRILLEGKKCAFWKTKENWKTSFSSILLPDKRQSGEEDAEGIRYEDYLRMFYTLKSKEEVRMRSIDMLESNLRQGEEMEFFFADQCVNKLEIQTTCRFRRGITYKFHSYYEYQ